MTAYPKGEILQIASPTEMYRSPVRKFVASFLGSCGISVVVIILLASSAMRRLPRALTLRHLEVAG